MMENDERKNSYLISSNDRIETKSFGDYQADGDNFIVGAFKIEVQNHFIQGACNPTNGMSAVSALGIRLWPPKSKKGGSATEVRVMFVNCPQKPRMWKVTKVKDVITMYLDSFVTNAVIDMLYSEKEVQFIYMERAEGNVGIIQYYQPEKK